MRAADACELSVVNRTHQRAHAFVCGCEICMELSTHVWQFHSGSRADRGFFFFLFLFLFTSASSPSSVWFRGTQQQARAQARTIHRAVGINAGGCRCRTRERRETTGGARQKREERTVMMRYNTICCLRKSVCMCREDSRESSQWVHDRREMT